ncbi:MAG: Ig-like domain-containing protein, partial [Candidatus Methanomethyliaceae archaeon]
YFAVGAKTLAPDTTPPTIASFSPEGTVAEKRPLIIVKYSDDVAIDTLRVRLLVDNVDVTALATINSTALTYRPGADLSEGTHSVYFEVTDTSGNKATKSWSFIIADITPPVISAVSPANNSVLTTKSVTISASYSDNVAIDVSSVVLKVDNVDVTSRATVTSTGVTYSTTLEEGTHTVALTVKDTSGNTATATWSFAIRLPVVDTLPPTITIVSPANNSVLTTKSVTISASYSDNVAIDVSSVVLKVDNVDVTSRATVTSTGVTYSTTLEEGTHTVALTVKDTSGNTATATWSFAIRLPVDYTPYIVGAVVLIVVIVAIFVLLRKKK